jgi:hypothetical protein
MGAAEAVAVAVDVGALERIQIVPVSSLQPGLRASDRQRPGQKMK